MTTDPKITCKMIVQIDLKDDTHARFEVDSKDTLPKFLERNEVYVTHTTLVRTNGPSVPGKLMSYGNEVSYSARLLDVASSMSHLLLRPVDASLDSEPVIAIISSCTQIRNTKNINPFQQAHGKAPKDV